MNNILKHLIMITAVCTLSTGCATTNDTENSTLESYNRAMFEFNNQVDTYVMKPVAKGYRAITTDFIRKRVRNFFYNLKEPASVINHSLQGNFAQSGHAAGRFVINSTLGLFGTFDVASGWGLEKNKTGFDKTLASWCVPDGPFIVLPFLGPSTPRATTGWLADAVADPTYWAEYYANFGQDWEKYSFYYGISALGFISIREENLEFLDSLTANAVDPYSMVKSAYIQNRLQINTCKTQDTEQSAASYDFDFDDEDDD